MSSTETNPESVESTLKNARISVIIPSFDGSRGGNVDRLKAALEAQTIKPHETIVVIGVSPNGKARNVGVEQASGDYYAFIDDDVELGNDDLLEALIRPFVERDDVGMTGASQLIPKDSNWLQVRCAEETTRASFPVQTELTDSDMVCHMCLCMPAKLFKEVGWENPEIIAGTDPDLRHRVREAGYRVCIVPNSWAYHPMPATFRAFVRLAYKKGYNSAIVRKTHPDLMLEVNDGHSKEFVASRPLYYRVFRRFGLLIRCVLSLRFFALCESLAYGVGFLLASARPAPKSA